MQTPLSLAQVTGLLQLAEKRAGELGVSMTFAVVDAAGHLIALHRMDGAQWIGSQIAFGKAYSAAAFRRPSGEMGERLREFPMFGTAITVMTHGSFTPQGGGLPAVRSGEAVGAIGVSGGTAEQDIEVAQAALKGAGLV